MAGVLIRMKLRIIRNSMTGGKAACMVIGAVLGVVFAGATIGLALAPFRRARVIADLLAATFADLDARMAGRAALGRFRGPARRPLRPAAAAATPARRRAARSRVRRHHHRGDRARVPQPRRVRRSAGSLPALVSIPAAAAQLVFVVLLSRVAYAFFGAVASSRIGAGVTGVLFAALLVLTQSGWMLVVAIAYSRVLTTGFSSAAVRHGPGDAVRLGGGRGRRRRPRPVGAALGALAGLLVRCALLLLGWGRALAAARHDRAVVRGSDGGTAPAARPARGPHRRRGAQGTAHLVA